VDPSPAKREGVDFGFGRVPDFSGRKKKITERNFLLVFLRGDLGTTRLHAAVWSAFRRGRAPVAVARDHYVTAHGRSRKRYVKKRQRPLL
jgi:hypothetical protein